MVRRCGLALMVLASSVLAGSGWAGDDSAVAERLARVREIHGGPAHGRWPAIAWASGR